MRNVFKFKDQHAAFHLKSDATYPIICSCRLKYVNQTRQTHEDKRNWFTRSRQAFAKQPKVQDKF